MFRRRRRPEDFAAELDAHLELERERLEADGLDPEAARAAARRAFGNVTRARERFYESGRWRWLDHVIQDLRFAARLLRRSPGFSAVAILTMALGIGATTAIFSVVDAVLLHPLPYPHPEALVRLEDDLPGVGARDVGMSQPEWQDIQHSGIFENVSPSWYDDNNMTGAARPTRVSLLIVAPNYFSILGVSPQLGRAFPPNNYSPGFTLEVVISDGLWKRQYGGDPAVLGRTLWLDTDAYRIVGVMPPGFQSPGTSSRERTIDVWAATSFFGPPMVMQPPRNGRNLPTAIGRLKAGLTLDDAQRRIDALVRTLQTQYPTDYSPTSAWALRLVPLKASVLGGIGRSILLLFGAVGLVLVVGCVNVANLLLARASVRGREMAIRAALGGSRARLVRQLLTESVLLSILGGVAGLAVLYLAQRGLLRLVPDSLPRLTDISMSGAALGFAITASVVTGVLFGLVPALQVDRRAVTPALGQQSRSATSARTQVRTRQVLVVTEFALALVLMVASGLLVRSFWDVLHAPLGFNPNRLITVRTRMPYPNDTSTDRYATPARERTFIRALLDRSLTIPGVEEVAAGGFASAPLGHDRDNQNPPVPLILDGHDSQATDTPLVDDAVVTPGYFRLTGMTVLSGRLFDDADTDETPRVAVVNESMARTYWPAGQALGQRFKISRRATAWTTVVGIIANARTESLEDAVVPEVYTNLYQTTEKHLVIYLRGDLDPAAMTEAVRAHVQAIDPTLPVFAGERLPDTVSAALAGRRFSMEMVVLFALTGLVLAGLGIYGVIAYAVSERSHEIGIRLALGAERRAILRMILGQGLSLTVVGAAIGVPVAAIASRLMVVWLRGVQPFDPTTFLGVTALLLAVAIGACGIPALRAMRVDPTVVLRHD